MNLEIKVAKVACQTWVCEFLLEDSSDTWIPKASESESAMAIIRIPLMMTACE